MNLAARLSRGAGKGCETLDCDSPGAERWKRSRLSANRLSARYPDRIAFTDVSFSLESGQALIVSGENGAGKTTLLKTVAGLIAPAEGRIELHGVEKDIPLSLHCHYLGHEDALQASLSAKENLRFWKGLLGPGMEISEALKRVGMPKIESIPIMHLSAGQKRRVALARLLATKRQIWLVDEPTGVLDEKGSQLFMEVAHEHLGEGGIIVAATHRRLNLENAAQLEMSA